MKRLWQGLVICCMGLIFMFAGSGVAGATDVWVAHWNSENVDVYVMDDTISNGVGQTGKWFAVSTKMVQNGYLKEVVTWRFSQYKTDMWRYRTNTMSGGHTTPVVAPNKIFEFAMNRIGWYYQINDLYYK